MVWSNSEDAFSKLGKITFVAVLGPLKAAGLFNDKEVTFWTENGLVNYPSVLINAHHHRKVKDEVLLNFNKKSVIFADSGGLQAVTLKTAKPDIRELTKWQEAHSNIAFGFDELPFLSEGTKLTGWLFDEKHFLDYADRTRNNLDIALETRTNPNFKIYGMIQGRNYYEYLNWYERVKCDVDGYCVKSPSNNPMNVAETVLFVHSVLKKPVHFLGMSSISKTILLYYLNTFYKEKITFDSSTCMTGSRYRIYYVPQCFSFKIRVLNTNDNSDISELDSGNVGVTHTGTKTVSFCNCPVCSILSDEQLQELVANNDNRLGGLLDIHNLWLFKNLYKLFEAVGSDRASLIKFIKGVYVSSIVDSVERSFDFIDYGMAHGYERAAEKYKKYMSINSTIINQKSIFSF